MSTVASKPVEEKIIWSSHEKRPDWTIKEPFEKNGDLLFVGLSDKFATEKEARDSAQGAAISNVVKYIGTGVKDKFQKIQTAYGLSTDVIDPTVATRKFEEQLSEAVARRVKPVEWYIEKWERKYKKYSEYYFEIFLLAKVPKTEIDNSIKEQLAQQEKQCKTAKSANDKLSKANDSVIEGEQKISADPQFAFTKFQNAIRLAEKAKWQVVEFPGLAKITEYADNIISSAKEKLVQLGELSASKIIVCILSKSKSKAKYRSIVETEIADVLSTEGYDITAAEELGISQIDENTYEKLVYRAGTIITGTYSTEYLGDKVTLPGGKVTDFVPSYNATISAKVIELSTKKIITSKNMRGKGFDATKDEAERQALKKAAASIAQSFVGKLPISK